MSDLTCQSISFIVNSSADVWYVLRVWSRTSSPSNILLWYICPQPSSVCYHMQAECPIQPLFLSWIFNILTCLMCEVISKHFIWTFPNKTSEENCCLFCCHRFGLVPDSYRIFADIFGLFVYKKTEYELLLKIWNYRSNDHNQPWEAANYRLLYWLK